MKKLFATLLALVMMLSVMSVTAFAADNYTVTAPANGHTYEVYQIFTGDLADNVLSNVKWGANGTGEVGKPVDKDTLKALEDVNADGATDTAKLAEINNLVKFSSSPVATLSASTLSASVPAGYYLIKDQDGSVTGNDAYTTYIVKVVNDVEFNTKSDVPSVDKKIVEGENRISVNEASIGDAVNYEIVGKLPSNIADYNTYFYQFNDTLSKGLTYNDDMVITVGGVDVTKYFYTSDSANADGSTTIKVTIADLLALSKLDGVTITKDSEIVLTYSATLNKDAVIAGEGNPNKVDLTYSNNPNQSGEPTTGDEPDEPNDEPKTTNPTGKTPEVDVVTFTTELTITKIDDKDNILTGAEFQLTGNGVNVMVVTKDSFVEDANGSYWKLKDGSFTTDDPATKDMDQSKYADINTKYSMSTSTEVLGNGQTKTDVKAFVGDDGKLTFTGLGAGEYTLTETTTPAGYNTIAPIKFTVSFDADSKTFSSDNANVVVGATNTLATTVVNQSGATLPETGGIGTRIFYAVGGILLVGAAVMLVAKKRMDAED